MEAGPEVFICGLSLVATAAARVPFTSPSCPAGVVEAGPDVCAVSLRAPKQMPAAVGCALRILSYNILADQYAGSTFAQQVCEQGGEGSMPAALLHSSRCVRNGLGRSVQAAAPALE